MCLSYAPSPEPTRPRCLALVDERRGRPRGSDRPPRVPSTQLHQRAGWLPPRPAAPCPAAPSPQWARVEAPPERGERRTRALRSAALRNLRGLRAQAGSGRAPRSVPAARPAGAAPRWKDARSLPLTRGLCQGVSQTWPGGEGKVRSWVRVTAARLRVTWLTVLSVKPRA